MTDKQFKYITDICPQTIDCGKHTLKPLAMSKKIKAFPYPITQNLIKYGKEWRKWCKADDEKFRLNRRSEYTYLDLSEYHALEAAIQQMEESLKEMSNLEKTIEKQLDGIGWPEFEYNLDNYEGEQK